MQFGVHEARASRHVSKSYKRFQALSTFYSKKTLKSAKNNLSLDGAKKKNYAFGLKVSFLTNFLIKICDL